MSQLIKVTVTNRGQNLDALKTPTLYGFDVEDIVSPIRRNGNLNKSYFTSRTIKDGVNNNHNGAKIDYMVSDTLASIFAQSSRLLLLNVVSRRGVAGNNEQYIFVSSKISENLIPLNGGAKFFYIEDGDPLPVEYVVSQSVATIVSMSLSSFIAIQDRGVNMPLENKLNFIGYTVEDNPGLSTDVYNIKDETWTKLNTMKTAGALPVGAWYRITDRYNYQSGATGIVPNKAFLGDDRGYVYIRAITPNSFSKEVIRVMACPLSYSNTINAVTSIGVWNLTKPVVSGNKTIWGSKVWTNNTGAIGTSVNSTKLDIVNWTLVSKSTTPAFYTDKQFRAVYDFDNDWFEKQYDGKGNEFGVPFTGYLMDNYPYNFNPCDISDWNQKQTGIYGSCIENNRCNGVFNNISQVITNNHFVGHINHCGSGDIVGNVLSRPLFYNIENLGISGGGFSLYNNEYTQGGSEIYPTDLNITGLTTIDLSTIGLGTAPYLFVKRINLISTNPTETITIFSANCFQSGYAHNILFTVNAGLEVTFVHGTPSASPPYQPLCEGTFNAVLNGTNGDWIEFELFNNGVKQKNIGTY